jgi:hypothetical protein
MARFYVNGMLDYCFPRKTSCNLILELNEHRLIFSQMYVTRLIEFGITIIMALQPFGPWPLFQFLLNPIHNLQDSFEEGSARRKACTYTQNKRTQTSMPRVGFEDGSCLRPRATHRQKLVCVMLFISFILSSFNDAFS